MKLLLENWREYMKERTDVKKYEEIEFVCVNPDYFEATCPVDQESLWKDLSSVEGIVAYKQNWGDGQISLAVILRGPESKNEIFSLAKRHGVRVDMTNTRTDRFLDLIVRGDLEHLAGVIYT